MNHPITFHRIGLAFAAALLAATALSFAQTDPTLTAVNGVDSDGIPGTSGKVSLESVTATTINGGTLSGNNSGNQTISRAGDTVTLSGAGGSFSIADKAELGDFSASSPLVYNSGTGAFSIPAATSSADGYLTSSDWSLFDSKLDASDLSTTPSAVLSYSSGTGVFTLAQSSATSGGYLSAADWSRFDTIAGGGITLSDLSATAPATYDPVNGIIGWSGDTDDVGEGSGNLYFTDARARAALSGGTGISYDPVNGIITNSQDAVTLDGTPDYITISGQTLTRNAVDLSTDITGTLDEANIDPDIARDSELHAAVTLDANADTLLGLSTQQIGLDVQNANKVLAGPATGADAVPTFRALVDADVPSAIARDSELPAGANPSASVGLTATNGSAATFMRSDAAPALDQSISPVWTGTHTFSALGYPTIQFYDSDLESTGKLQTSESFDSSSVWTLPNASALLAGTNITQSWSNTQTFTDDVVIGETAGDVLSVNATARFPNATSVTNALKIGGDARIYRSSPNVLTTPDGFGAASVAASAPMWRDYNLVGLAFAPPGATAWTAAGTSAPEYLETSTAGALDYVMLPELRTGDVISRVRVKYAGSAIRVGLFRAASSNTSAPSWGSVWEYSGGSDLPATAGTTTWTTKTLNPADHTVETGYVYALRLIAHFTSGTSRVASIGLELGPRSL